jgi:hypothetical protein
MAKPTLALIPAAQGSKFYSVLPSNGVGDFNFTRSGSATRINKDGLIETVSSGVSRLNYPLIDGVVKGCPHHILEPQRTNLIQYSEDFSNAYWTKIDTTISLNSIISPNGTLSASKLIEGSNNGLHRLRVNSTSTSSDNTLSFFVKADERKWVLLREAGQTGAYAYFNLENGVIGQSNLAENIEIKQFNDDWYRISFKDSVTSVAIELRLALSDGVDSYQGDGTSGVYIYGAQVEQGSYPTSYIPTNGSEVTRSAETVASAGDASTFNSQSGALFGEFKTDPDGGNFLISISEDNNNGGAVFIGADASEKIYTYYNSANHVSDINSYDSFNKVCISWGSDGVKVYINGLSKTVLGSQALSTSNYNNIKFSRANTSLKFLGQIKDLRVYKTALTDDELQTLTKI